MKIRRQDLVAASSLGLLQPNQIGPLYLFLLQRDVHAKRIALVAEARTSQRSALWRLLTHVAAWIGVLTTVLFATLLLTSNPAGNGVLLAFSLLYTFCVCWAAIRFRKRPVAGRGRTLPVLALMAVPLAMLMVGKVAA
jgi:hypothetical protein